jgi:hypothetical protein
MPVQVMLGSGSSFHMLFAHMPQLTWYFLQESKSKSSVLSKLLSRPIMQVDHMHSGK